MGRIALTSWILTLVLAYFGLGGLVGKLVEGYDRAELSLLPLVATGLALLASTFCTVVWLRRPRAGAPSPPGQPASSRSGRRVFLLGALSDFQVTVPELGTIKAEEPPIVIITSNRTREIHDALKRRCLYHWVDYPDAERELAILEVRAPEVGRRLSEEVVAFVQRLRSEDLFKRPGVSETIDWAKCLVALDALALDPQTVSDTLGALLKYQDDIARFQGSQAKRMLDAVKQAMAGAAWCRRHPARGPRAAGGARPGCPTDGSTSSNPR